MTDEQAKRFDVWLATRCAIGSQNWGPVEVPPIKEILGSAGELLKHFAHYSLAAIDALERPLAPGAAAAIESLRDNLAETSRLIQPTVDLLHMLAPHLEVYARGDR